MKKISNQAKSALIPKGLSGLLKPALLMLVLVVLGGFNNANAQITPVIHTADNKTASGSETSLSVARPDNLVAGNLIILVFTQQRSSDVSAATSGFTVPTGFTLIRNEHDAGNTARPEIAAYYKIATASEPANYTSTVTNFGNTPNWKAIAMRITSYDPRNPIQANSGTYANSNSITIPTLTTAENNSLLVAAMTVRAAITPVAATPTGMTQVWFLNGTGTGDNNANQPAFRGSSQTIATAGSTGTRQFQWDVSARTAGLMFAINPLPCVFGTVSTTNPTCIGGNNGIITVTSPTGGSDTYEYRLDAGTWQSSNTFTGLAPGTYSVQIRDANNTTCAVTLGSYTLATSAVVYDNVSSNVFNSGTTATLNHTTGSGENRLMLVGISTRSRYITVPAAGEEASTVSYDGNNLIYLGTEQSNSDAVTYLFMLPDPPSGTAQLSVDFTSALGSSNAAVVGITTYSNVDLNNPVGNYFSSPGNDANPTLTITATKTNQIVFNVLVTTAANTTVTPNSGQTQRWLQSTANRPTGGGYGRLGSATSTTFNYTLSSSQRWSLSGVAINPSLVADLAVTKTINEPNPYVGQEITFTLTATNLGCDNALNVSVLDQLPDGYIYVSHSTATGTFSPGNGVWDIGTLSTEVTGTLEITAVVTNTGNYNNIATISGNVVDNNTANNSASATITVCQAGGTPPLFNN